MSNKVVVIGQGYVGLPIAVRAVRSGYSVIGLDSDSNRVNSLKSLNSFVEDVSEEDLAEISETGRYLPTTDVQLAECFDYAVITVPTPLRESVPDLSFIESAARSIAPHIRPGATVILESTTYPGTTEELLVPILENGSGLSAWSDFFVGYSPERIDPGNVVWHFENTPKVVSGLTKQALEVIIEFYSSLVSSVVPVSGCREAELTKLLENTFRHVNIALVNELAIFANQLDINVWEAIDAASTKPFGFMRFLPGPGVGGHCLPIDPSYLSWKVRQSLGHQFRFVELANDINDHMPDYVVGRITRLLNARRQSIRDSQILVVGLAYKKNSGDARESPAVRVIEILLELGAQVDVLDPHVAATSPVISDAKLIHENQLVVEQYDLTVILTDHDLIDYERLRSEAHLIFDTRHRLAEAANVVFL